MEGCVLQRKPKGARPIPSTDMAISLTRPQALPPLRRVLIVGGGGREQALAWALSSNGDDHNGMDCSWKRWS
jgi:hypothetical protein